jgi:HemY protein
MRRILYFLLACIVVLAVAWLLAGLPGRITAEIGDTTVEAATPVAMLGLLLAFVILYLLVRLLVGLVRLPWHAGRWRSARQRRHGDVAVTRTLLALAAGAKADARREAQRARRMLGDTPQTLLLAAEAGRLAGRDDEAEAAFRRLAERNDAAFLGYRGLLRRAIARDDWTEAAVLARQAEAVQPGAAWLRQERVRLAIRAGNWAEATELVDGAASRAALAAAASEAEPDRARALKLARQAWKDDSALAPAALAYAEKLRADGREGRAFTVVRHSWTLAPQPDLATFALAPLSDKLARVKAAQRLTEANPSHIESRLLLARTSLEAGLAGEARRQAEAARDAGVNQRRLWLLLADIEEHEHGNTEAGRAAQREALRRAAVADPDPQWHCTVCHVPSTAWHPACANCGSPGGLQWQADAPASYAVPAVVA